MSSIDQQHLSFSSCVTSPNPHLKKTLCQILVGGRYGQIQDDYIQTRSISPRLRSLHDVVANVHDCDIVVSDFKLQSRYNVHF